MPKTLATHQINPYSKSYPAEHVKAMEDVLSIPSGPRRWRAAASIWLNLNKIQPESALTAEQEYKAVCRMVKDMQGDQKNKFSELLPATGGAVGGSGIRHGFEMPAGMWAYIKMFDKTAFDHNNPDASRNVKRLVKEFPELSIAERF